VRFQRFGPTLVISYKLYFQRQAIVRLDLM
jgi:hypothetical protein